MSDEQRKAPGRRAIETGPTGKTVGKNLARLRQQRGITTRQLSAQLAHAGRLIPASGITRMEQGERQVTADDLVALAIVLNTSPISLLLPAEWGDVPVQLTSERQLMARTAWRWIRGLSPASDYGVAPSEIVAGPDDDEWEDDFDRKYWQLRQDYDAVTLPPELRRVRENPATRDADAVTFEVERLVRLAGGKAGDEAFEDQMATTRNAIDRLSTELERLAEERARRRAEAGAS
ncbi:helix-turn-helix domain-containing protein [Streptomyces ipomoeae]|nr:helix-turn-helix transcriptional regulator [Streptomyces ipomoeae]